MSILNDFLISKRNNYWDFEKRKKTLLEKNIKYPAKMVSSMQLEILDFFSKNINFKIDSVLDPFMGSGTIIDVAASLGIKKIFGNDLNPYSFIINKLKYSSYKFDSKILKEELSLFKMLFNNLKDFKIHKFNKIDKWYKIEVIKEVSKIRHIIYSNEWKYSNVYEIALINIAKEFSNDRNSTSKLHIKKEEAISKISEDKILQSFLSYSLKIAIAIKEEIEPFLSKTQINLYNKNSISLDKFIKNKKIDLIMTSPPYGDNKTTISYGQFSILPLLWLKNAVSVEYENNFSKIDNDSLGGKLRKKSEFSEIIENSQTLKTLFLKLKNDKRVTKVLSFLEDYFNFLKSADRILNSNGFLIMTLGNRRVADEIIYLDKITFEFLGSIGNYRLVDSINRNIIQKTIPRIIKSNNGIIKSINEETIIFVQKK
ncbi:site-specific DNA-methyltransferase (cytosine-N4-specific) [Spiroplasma sabaudiense Ar-1343]|uniref:site-specific DNA-methyltransferase (cytosine-N(4)-specific) n=1 Tax=Spiroplasma sabaudiense Ar-1343 TaxID=1276257 RepID=W6A9Z6_9MOLU|nr:DNA methyltransferase [Spiroplasma sabaudiense]AHI53806.1 site-specific DNA-methyltransferase (cytosine-N4-specific) [Spiroplasma sabaudiense Ar-1343]